MLISSALVASLSFFILSVSNGYASFPKPLKAKEERELLEKFQNGDVEARNKLIEHNLRLVAHIAKKYYSNNSEQEDLISIGTLGLIKGVSTFKFDKGSKLSTYVSRCIENVILSQRRQRVWF
ncbi:MAG: sigma-70 family RNA polymerase sigma factor [Clostridia bacterium]